MPSDSSDSAVDRSARRAERRRRLQEGRFDTSVPSPCVAICQMDETNSHCIGCGRSLDEIREWIIMTADEKRRVLARLAAEFPPAESPSAEFPSGA